MKNKKVLITISAIIFIICYSFIIYNIMFSPKKIFSKAINIISKNVNENIEELDFKNCINDFTLNFNTNNENFKSLMNYTYGLKFGIDGKNKKAEAKAYITSQDKKEYSYTGYIIDSNLYHKLSSVDRLILYNYENQDFSSLFERANLIDYNDIKYLNDKISKSLINNLNTKKLSRKLANIKIDGKSLKVMKNTYEIDYKENYRLYNAIINDLFNDPKASKIITSLTGMTKKQLKNNLQEEPSDTIITFNIYNKFNKLLGFDIKLNEEEIISYYKKGKKFNIVYGNYYIITGNEKDKKLEVTIDIENTKLATMTFNKYKKDDFVFDFQIGEYTGKVSYNKIKSKETYNKKIDISIDNGKENYSFNVNYKKQLDNNIANIDINGAELYSEKQFNEALENFYLSLRETFLNPLINSLTYDDVDVNYYEDI